VKNMDILHLVLEELKKAKVKHPIWPDDIIHRAAIVVEEAGELIQAAVDYKQAKNEEEKKKACENMIVEAAQTGAMAFRFLENIDELEDERGDKNEKD
jgi:hypothetical protein